mgnify:CR=1 FL=1
MVTLPQWQWDIRALERIAACVWRESRYAVAGFTQHTVMPAISGLWRPPESVRQYARQRLVVIVLGTVLAVLISMAGR